MSHKPTRLPPGAIRRHNQHPWADLQLVSRQLYYGNESGTAPGAPGMFRAVAVLGAVLTQETLLEEPVITCGGGFTIDDKEPAYAQALADYLRSLADQLDREAGS